MLAAYGLLLALWVGTGAGVSDFGDGVGNFHFFFHHYTHLLLTIYEGPDSTGHLTTACYFASIDPGVEDMLLGPYRSLIEQQVIEAITFQLDNHRSDQIENSTISEMRDTFQDRLADFHCLNNYVYTLQVDYLRCSFNIRGSLCAWTQGYMDTMDWLQRGGSTTTAFTGPDRDHTKPRGDGLYIYMEANDGEPGDTADLVSPPFTLTEPMCLKFWYFMFGSTMGQLQVFKISSTDVELTFIYNLTGDHKQSWRKAEVAVWPSSSQGETIVLGLRATRGSDIYSDIAIDDVSTSPGPCTASSISCDFEQPGSAGYCEWHMGERGAMDWILHKGRTPTMNTGPDVDHTRQDVQGQYLYVEGNEGNPQDKAILVSPILELKEPICMEFSYHMKGSSVGQLSIFIRDVQTQRESILWSASGHRGDDWQSARVTVVLPQDYDRSQIVFKATRGDSIESDIAIDDISGTPGTCVTIQDR